MRKLESVTCLLIRRLCRGKNTYIVQRGVVQCINPSWTKDGEFSRPRTYPSGYRGVGRNYFNASKIFPTVPGLSRQKEYQGRKLVGFTMEQMYGVVSDVEEYKNFVPFCMDSVVSKKTPSNLWGKLVIGFPPLLESYVSYVTLRRPTLVRAECSDGKVLNYLKTTWKFTPGLQSQPQSCVVHFYLSFEFKSMIHSQLANVFFNELVRKMEGAFIKEAERRYGQPSMNTVKLKSS